MTSVTMKYGWLGQPHFNEPRKKKEKIFVAEISGSSAVWSRIMGLEEFFRKYLVHTSASTEKRAWA